VALPCCRVVGPCQHIIQQWHTNCGGKLWALDNEEPR
jgi:hypothetical protein